MTLSTSQVERWSNFGSTLSLLGLTDNLQIAYFKHISVGDTVGRLRGQNPASEHQMELEI